MICSLLIQGSTIEGAKEPELQFMIESNLTPDVQKSKTLAQPEL